jgi:hypothetical protein
MGHVSGGSRYLQRRRAYYARAAVAKLELKFARFELYKMRQVID